MMQQMENPTASGGIQAAVTHRLIHERHQRNFIFRGNLQFARIFRK